MRTISVPLTLISLHDDGYHILVEINVFGHKHWAVVDTGASRSVFDKRFIEENIKEVLALEDSSATTLFTTSATVKAVLPKLKIGKLIIRNYPAVALDLDAVNEAYALLEHPRVVAIIGSDIFYSYNAKINYKKQKIYFSHKQK